MNITIRGAGELASGVAFRLHQAGFEVVMTELEQPTCVCQAASFAEGMRLGSKTVEGVTARRVASAREAARLAGKGELALLADTRGDAIQLLKPAVLVDAIMAKRNTGTTIRQAPLVIGLGPGFIAGEDVQAVIETKRGHHLGRVITSGSAEPNTGVPELIDGQSVSRLLLAPAAGRLRPVRAIGDRVRAGDVAAYVDDRPVVAGISGVVRGLLPEGFEVSAGMKVGDLDPSAEPEDCRTLSDRALSVGSGVLAAILELWPKVSGEPAMPPRIRGRRPNHLPEGELLGAGEFALLGLLRRGPAHGYELSRAFADRAGLGGVVRLRLSQLYADLAKLESLGLVCSSRGPERKVFSLTDSGERHFLAWVSRPVPKVRYLRLDFMVKLYFARDLGPEVRRRLLEEQIAVVREEVVGLPAACGESFEAEVALARREFAEAALGWLERLGCAHLE